MVIFRKLVVDIELKLAIVKRRKLDWSGNDVQLTLHSNFKMIYLFIYFIYQFI